MFSHTRFYSEDHSSNHPKLKRLPHLNPKSVDLASPHPEYLSILEGLDKLCDSYDQLPEIEFESDEKCSESSSPKPVESSKLKVDSKLNFIINQLKFRIKNYPKAQAAYPASNRFKVFSGTEEKVGPGTYKLIPNGKLETFEFSNIPRLFTPIAHTMHTIESLYKNRKELPEDTLIRKNKFLAFQPQIVKEELLGKKNHQKKKELKNKQKRVRLESLDHHLKEIKLQEKIRKFEWRLNKEEVAQVQKTWAVLVSIFGLGSVMQLRVEVKRILRIRWGKTLKKFCVICKSLGKVLNRIKKIRARNARRTISNLLTPTAEYLKSLVLQNKTIVRWIIDKYRDMPIIISLLAKWKKSIIKLQINWKIAKKVLKARKIALGLLWDRLSDNMLKTKMMEKIHRSSTIDRSYLFPCEIKEMFIKKFLKSVLVDYSKAKKEFVIMEKLAEKKKELGKTNSDFFMKKPILVLYTHKEKLQTFIERASIYRFKLEKRQRELRYNIQGTQLTRSLTKNLNK